MNSQPSQSPSASKKPGPSHRLVRGRILLSIVCLTFVTIAVLGLVNIFAISTYNQATRSLNTSIAELNKSISDPTKIAANQNQAEQLFSQAQTLSPLLLPKTRQAIEEGKTVCTKLTQAIKEKKRVLGEAQTEGQQDGGTRQGSNASSGGSGDKTGLTQEQQDKIDKLLQQNQEQPGSSPSPGTQDKEEKKPAKPW